jgi:hypothetical protein
MVKNHKQIAALFASLTLCGFAAVPMTAKAGTESSAKESKAVVEEAKKSYISGDIGFIATNDYLSRGIMQTPEAGVKFQPYLDLYFKLYEGTGFINNVTFNLGFWSNLESDTNFAPAAGQRTNVWEEFDWMPGIAVTFAKNFTFTVSYFEFDSPNQSFSAARSINLNLAYNDTDLLGMWALHPHVTFLQEVDGHAGLNAGGNNKKEGQYYEVGIAPAFTFMKDSKYAPTLTIPVTAGFGSNGFYGTGFGYFSAGGTISVPLAFIPSGFGAWTANVGGTYYYLGQTTADVAGPLTGSNGDRHNVGVAFGGIGLTF